MRSISILTRHASSFHRLGPHAINEGYKGNSIRTSKYNVFTFLSFFLYAMFSRIAYLYFLCQASMRLPPLCYKTSWAPNCCACKSLSLQARHCVSWLLHDKACMRTHRVSRFGAQTLGQHKVGMWSVWVSGLEPTSILLGSKVEPGSWAIPSMPGTPVLWLPAGGAGLVEHRFALLAIRANHRARICAAGGCRQGRHRGQEAPQGGPHHQQQHRPCRAE